MTMRIRKLSRPGLQLKLVGSFMGMTSLALLLQFLFLGGRLTSALAKIPKHGGDVAEQVPSMLLSVLLVSAIVVLPLMFCLGVVMTHKIAGPVYRFEEYLGQIARGEKVGPCRIRKGDELQELCKRLNSAIAKLRSEANLTDTAYISHQGLDVAGLSEPPPALPIAPLPSSSTSEPEEALVRAGEAEGAPSEETSGELGPHSA